MSTEREDLARMICDAKRWLPLRPGEQRDEDDPDAALAAADRIIAAGYRKPPGAPTLAITNEEASRIINWYCRAIGLKEDAADGALVDRLEAAAGIPVPADTGGEQ